MHTRACTEHVLCQNRGVQGTCCCRSGRGTCWVVDCHLTHLVPRCCCILAVGAPSKQHLAVPQVAWGDLEQFPLHMKGISDNVRADDMLCALQQLHHSVAVGSLMYDHAQLAPTKRTMLAESIYREPTCCIYTCVGMEILHHDRAQHSASKVARYLCLHENT
jgi:hypothetical protein